MKTSEEDDDDEVEGRFLKKKFAEWDRIVLCCGEEWT